MPEEQGNKAIVGRRFAGVRGNPWGPEIVDELVAPDMLSRYSLRNPRRGRDDIEAFMTGFREAFPDLGFEVAADLIAEGDFVVSHRQGGGTHTDPASSDFLVGSFPAASCRKMHSTGMTVLRVENGKIAEEIGLDDGGITAAVRPDTRGLGEIQRSLPRHDRNEQSFGACVGVVAARVLRAPMKPPRPDRPRRAPRPPLRRRPGRAGAARCEPTFRWVLPPHSFHIERKNRSAVPPETWHLYW